MPPGGVFFDEVVLGFVFVFEFVSGAVHDCFRLRSTVFDRV